MLSRVRLLMSWLISWCHGFVSCCHKLVSSSDGLAS